MTIPAIGIGPLGSSEWSVGSVSGSGAIGGTSQSAATSGNGSFSSALTSAIGALEDTQSTASTAADQLATGQTTDPTQAVTAVENAQMAMDLASQLRNQVTTDATTLFQTQM